MRNQTQQPEKSEWSNSERRWYKDRYGKQYHRHGWCHCDDAESTRATSKWDVSGAEGKLDKRGYLRAGRGYTAPTGMICYVLVVLVYDALECIILGNAPSAILYFMQTTQSAVFHLYSLVNYLIYLSYYILSISYYFIAYYFLRCIYFQILFYILPLLS